MSPGFGRTMNPDMAPGGSIAHNMDSGSRTFQGHPHGLLWKNRPRMSIQFPTAVRSWAPGVPFTESPNHSQQTYSPIPSHWRLGLQNMELGLVTDIQTIAFNMKNKKIQKANPYTKYKTHVELAV